MVIICQVEYPEDIVPHLDENVMKQMKSSSYSVIVHRSKETFDFGVLEKNVVDPEKG